MLQWFAQQSLEQAPKHSSLDKLLVNSAEICGCDCIIYPEVGAVVFTIYLRARVWFNFEVTFTDKLVLKLGPCKC